MSASPIQGLPDVFLDACLLFSSTNGTLRRRPGFASYSWAGWEGEIAWPREKFLERTWPPESSSSKKNTHRIARWTLSETIVEWRSSEHQPRNPAELDSDEKISLADYNRGNPGIFPWKLNATNRKGEFCRLVDKLFAVDKRMNQMAVSARTGRTLKDSGRRKREEEEEATSKARPRLDSGLPYLVLQGRTIHLRLWLDKPPPSSPQTAETTGRHNEETQPVFSTIALPLYSPSGRLVGSLHPDSLAATTRPQTASPANIVDLVAVSLSQKRMAGSVLPEKKKASRA
ncbi:hypothetical protein RB600_008810 [Gaeumannomyces tritici]